jgi:hypothetical protein
MNESYKEFCVINCRFVLFVSNESKQTLSVADKWCQMVLLANSGLLNVTDCCHLYCLLLQWSRSSLLWTSTGEINAITAA